MTGVIVLGSHRCGTSAVAGVLHHLGVEMGGTGSHPPENPKGQFEDNFFVALNDLMFNWKELEWSGVDYGAIADGPLQVLIRKREAEHTLWGVKDPRLCFTARYYLPRMQDPRIILVTRDINAATASLQKRNGPGCTLRTQARHFAAAYDILADFPDVPLLEVRMEQLINSRSLTSQVNRIADFVETGSYDERTAAMNHIDLFLLHHVG
jgi:hypothetical protein